jgi:endonuclease/exonuclease/phosphatase family metal-dependent hydrolase
MRLLSYNIHKGIGGRDRRYRLERIIRVVAHEQPDLICLQEVDRSVRRSRYDDQPKRLAQAFEAAADLYQLNVPIGNGGYGNLLLSRWPFQGVHQVSLRKGRRKPRGAQLAVVESPTGPFLLGLVERERHWQVRHLLEQLHSRELESLPTLIVGDCNDWRNTLGHGPFARHGFSQITAPRERFRSFPAYFAVMSLDKAFIRGGLDILRAHVVRTPLARVASDHLPLVIDFQLRTTSPQ